MSCTVSKRPYEVALMDATPTAPDAAWWSPSAAGAAGSAAGFAPSAAAAAAAMDFGPAGTAGYLGTPPKRCRMNTAAGWTPTHALVSPDRMSPPPGPASAAFGAAGTPRPVALAGGRHLHHQHNRAAAGNSLGVYALPASSSTDALLEQFDHYLPRRKRTGAANGRDAGADRSVLFTYAEVKDIATRLLKDQEERLLAEFQSVLRDRLHEQYESFSKFNEDFMSRQLRESHFDYMT